MMGTNHYIAGNCILCKTLYTHLHFTVLQVPIFYCKINDMKNIMKKPK